MANMVDKPDVSRKRACSSGKRKCSRILGLSLKNGGMAAVMKNTRWSQRESEMLYVLVHDLSTVEGKMSRAKWQHAAEHINNEFGQMRTDMACINVYRTFKKEVESVGCRCPGHRPLYPAVTRSACLLHTSRQSLCHCHTTTSSVADHCPIVAPSVSAHRPHLKTGKNDDLATRFPFDPIFHDHNYVGSARHYYNLLTYRRKPDPKAKVLESLVEDMLNEPFIPSVYVSDIKSDVLTALMSNKSMDDLEDDIMEDVEDLESLEDEDLESEEDVKDFVVVKVEDVEEWEGVSVKEEDDVEDVKDGDFEHSQYVVHVKDEDFEHSPVKEEDDVEDVKDGDFEHSQYVVHVKDEYLEEVCSSNGEES